MIDTREILSKYNFRTRKKFGQNFLISDEILQEIVDAAEVGPDDYVVEIGPGIGSLTQYLAQRAGHVLAVEIDSDLIPILHDTLSDYDNVTVINQDVMDMDLKQTADEQNGGKPLKFVANLPYYITTPIILKILSMQDCYSSITVMIQKEVAERMQSGPGTKDYGALSLAVQYYTSPQVITKVPASCFIPQPKVDSAVIRLDKREEPPVSCSDPEKMFTLIRAAFNQRRKTLLNAISNAGITSISKEELIERIRAAGYNETVRGETLTLEDFARLTDSVFK